MTAAKANRWGATAVGEHRSRSPTPPAAQPKCPRGPSIEVRAGDVETRDLNGAMFDRIFSVNCIYFWRDVDAVLAKLAQALSPGGKLVLAFRPDGDDDIPARFRDPTYRFPRIEMVTAALEHVGVTIGAPSPTAARGIVLLVATRS